MRGFVAAAHKAALLACGAALLAGLSGIAEAKQNQEFTAGQWNGFSYTDDSNGQFTDCTVWAANRDNVQIGVSVKKDYTLAFWLYAKTWNLPTNQTYPVSFWVDQNPQYHGKASTRGNQSAAIDVDQGQEVFNELKQGGQLTVRTTDVDYVFDLTGSRQALSQLLDCTDRYSKASNTNPFGGGGAPNSGQQSDNGSGQQSDNQQNSNNNDNQQNDNQQQANQQNNNNSNNGGSSDDTTVKNPTVSPDDVQKFLVDVTGAKPSMIQVTTKTDKAGAQYYDFTTPLGGGMFWQEKLGSDQLEDVASNYLDSYKKDCKSGYEPSVNKPVQGQHGQLASGTAACSNSPYQSNGPEFLSYSMVTASDGIVSVYLSYTGGNAAKAKSDALGSLIEKRSEALVQ
jgi:hypothetical protein